MSTITLDTVKKYMVEIADANPIGFLNKEDGLKFAFTHKFDVDDRFIVEKRYDVSTKTKDAMKSTMLDFVAESDDGKVYFEFKYKTAKVTMNSSRKREMIDQYFKKYAAQTVNRRHFYKDIYRIEQYVRGMNDIKSGYAIFWTNDPKYWGVGTNSIHIIPQSFADPSDSTKVLTLDGHYEAEWVHYGYVKDLPYDLCTKAQKDLVNTEIRYAIVEIK